MNKKLAIVGTVVAFALTAAAAQAAVNVKITNKATVTNRADAYSNTGENKQVKNAEWNFDVLQNSDQVNTTGNARSNAYADNYTNTTELNIENSIAARRTSMKDETTDDPCECDEVDVDVVINDDATVKNLSDAEANTGRNEQRIRSVDNELFDQNGTQFGQDNFTGESESDSQTLNIVNKNDMTIRAERVRATRYSESNQ